jgi:DUF4097 and DUF4098 domain-containing protein YvlB
MSNDRQTAEQSSPKGPGGLERVESFVATGPVSARITSQSGDVTVHTGEGRSVEVTMVASSSKSEHFLNSAHVSFDVATNQLEIHTQPRDAGWNSLSSKKLKRSWFDFARSDLDVVVKVPRASSVTITTMSGDTIVEGPTSEISVSSMSGDIEVSESCENLDVRTASGDVRTGVVRDVLKCKSASGDVACGAAAKRTEITSASGDVELFANQAGKVTVRVVSGDIRVRVAAGLFVDVNASTVSGDMSSNIDFDGTDAPQEAEEPLLLHVTTVSGDVRIDKTP